MNTIGCALRQGGLALRWRWVRQLETERDEARAASAAYRVERDQARAERARAMAEEHVTACQRDAAQAHASHWRRDVAALVGLQAEGTRDSDLLARLTEVVKGGSDAQLADRVREAGRVPRARPAGMTFGNELGDWTMSAGRTCRACGCTDEKACLDGQGACYWVTSDLCSRCARPAAYDLDGDVFPPPGRPVSDGVVVDAEIADAETVWTRSTGWACGACGAPVAIQPCAEHQPRARAVVPGRPA